MMRGKLPCGLRFAQLDNVRVTLYAGSLAGTVTIESKPGEYHIARPGEVSYGTVIELTRQAMSVPEEGDGGQTPDK
jgi:hypothetical protein